LGVLEVVGVVLKRYKPKVYCLNPNCFDKSTAVAFARQTLQGIDVEQQPQPAVVVVVKKGKVRKKHKHKQKQKHKQKKAVNETEEEEEDKKAKYVREGPRFPTPPNFAGNVSLSSHHGSTSSFSSSSAFKTVSKRKRRKTNRS